MIKKFTQLTSSNGYITIVEEVIAQDQKKYPDPVFCKKKGDDQAILDATD